MTAQLSPKRALYSDPATAPHRHIRVTIDVVAVPDHPGISDEHLVDAVLRSTMEHLILASPSCRTHFAGLDSGVAWASPHSAGSALSVAYRAEMVDRQVNPEHREVGA
jgi:hypothetical protein